MSSPPNRSAELALDPLVWPYPSSPAPAPPAPRAVTPLSPARTFESVDMPPRVPHVVRPRSATVTTAITSEAAARSASTQELLEATAANIQDAVRQGVHIGRDTVATPTPVYPSIGPGLIVPPPQLAPPVTVPVNVSAEIVAPRPCRPTLTPEQLGTEMPDVRAIPSTRKGKKRARINSRTPSPSPAQRSGRAPPSVARRPSQVERARAQLARGPYTLAPAAWASPSSSRGRLRPATAAAIAAALLPLSAPTDGLSRQESAALTRSTSLGSDAMFDMDIPLPIEIPPAEGQAHPTFVFGSQVAPRDFGDVITDSARRLERGEVASWTRLGGTTTRRPTVTGSGPFGDDPLDVAQEGVQTPRQQQMHVHPVQAATPARPASQSAADLAASFVAPLALSQPIPVPTGPQLSQGTATGAIPNNAAHLGLHPMNPGAIGGLVFTPVPVGGFPKVVHADPEGLLLGLPDARVEALLNASTQCGPVLVLQIYNNTTPAPYEVRPITEAVATMFRQITGEINPQVVPPERRLVAGGEIRGPTSPTWVLLCNNEQSVDLALARPVWSTTIGTMLVYRPEVRIGRFMLIAGGFAHDRNGSILQVVFMVFSGPIILPIIFQLVQTNPRFADVTPEDATRAILASLEVRVSTLQNGNLIAAIFCDSPTQSIPRWRDWRDAVVACPFTSPLNSTGTARRPVPCAGCHGADHLTHMCPFQDVPGWNAPAAGTTWRAQPPNLLQGGAGQQNPPPPPPGGGAAAVKSRAAPPHRPNSSNYYNGPRRDFHGGGAGFGPGGGPGRGAGGGAAGATTC
ncbi:hypothetical protein TRAPUB_10380 [Trametes pubescens]|uniref:Uncharacterized protein n=1 Tax=Trametes pubescens TaxID=154538 RepID=A0A1M2VZM4_TRAPU|nr:hypothetical protein TRAPUB_10380 [Trametes pubescens]